MKKTERMAAIVGTIVSHLRHATIVDHAPPYHTDEIQDALWQDQQKFAALLERRYLKK